MEFKSRGNVTITVEEYELLREMQKVFNETLSSDKCVELTQLSYYERGAAAYVVNPPPDFVKTIAELKKDLEESKELWKKMYRGNNKKIRIWDIGKTIDEIVLP